MTLAVKVIYGHVQVGPEFTLMMFQIAMTLVASGVILIVLNNLWKLLRKPISKLMPVRQRKVEIRYVVPRNKFKFDQKMELVSVRFQNAKLRKQGKFWMKGGGIREGDQGILAYQGVFGIEFTKVDSALKDEIDYHQKYDFAKKKKQNAGIKKIKERTKRKYW